jgi:hypothetical protein
VINDDPVDFYTIMLPTVSPNWCWIQEFKIEEERVNGSSSIGSHGAVILSPSCNGAKNCTKLSLSHNGFKYGVKFKIRAVLEGGFSHLSNQISVTLGCRARSAKTTSSLINQNFTALQYTKFEIPFRIFSFRCEPTDCCTNMKFLLNLH